MIINDNKRLQIKGNEAEVFGNILEIFSALHEKEVVFKLTDKAPEYLQKYIKDFNNCINDAPKVLKLLLKETSNKEEL